MATQEQLDREKKDLDLLKFHTAAIHEHFDTVQIFCTRDEGSSVGTVSAAWGCGNWFARMGQISTWLTKRLQDSESDQEDEA